MSTNQEARVVFGQMAELLTQAVAVSKQVNRKEDLFKGAQAMWALRGRSVAWAHALVDQQKESARLRALGADIEKAKQAFKDTGRGLRLDVPVVAQLWQDAVDRLTTMDEAYKADGIANDAARIGLRIISRKAKHGIVHQSLDVLETYKREVQGFTRSDEERIRRAQVKNNLSISLQSEARRFQEGVEIEAFCNNQTRLFREIGEKLERLLPFMLAESEAAKAKGAFVAKMAAGKAAKAAKLAKQQAEEARIMGELEAEAKNVAASAEAAQLECRLMAEQAEKAKRIEVWQAVYEAAATEQELMGAAGELVTLGVRVDPLALEEQARDLRPRPAKKAKAQPVVQANLVADLDDEGIDWSRVDPRTSQRAQRRLAKQARR